MKYFNNILEAIGNTPLVKLNKVVGPDAATVLVKCEFMNPSGSIKDRMALHVVEQAEKSGELKPGGTIVENTSGNTGLALAMVGAVKGYRCIFTMPDKMSTEKINMLKAFGAEVVITPTNVSGDSPEHYVNVAKRMAQETPNAFYVNQYHTHHNIDAHFNSTAKEIWEQTGGEFDYFVAGTGTGGTASGVGRFLKQQGGKVKVLGVDPIGSVHYHYFYTKTMPTPHVYKVEGIGEDILCGAMDFEAVDEMVQTNDEEAFHMARRLVREEGLFCGGSSGAIVHGAVELAKRLGRGKTVVTVLTDSGSRYISKFLSDQWMRDYGFLERHAPLGYVEDLLAVKKGGVITARENEQVAHLIERMKSEGVSQLPVVDASGAPVAMLSEVDILRALQAGTAKPTSTAKEVAQPIEGVTTPKARLEELYKIFDNDTVAVVVDNQQILGIVSKIDLLDYMSKRL